MLNPYQAAELGYVDEVIAPHETRVRIISSLRALHDKRAATPREETREYSAVGVVHWYGLR